MDNEEDIGRAKCAQCVNSAHSEIGEADQAVSNADALYVGIEVLRFMATRRREFD